MEQEKKMTGYPSIDKPWLKYYSEEAKNEPLPEKTMFQFAYERNKNHLSDTAFIYFGNKITYKALFNNIEMLTRAFVSAGISKGDIVTIMSMQTPETIYAIYALDCIGAIADMVYMNLGSKELYDITVTNNSKMLMILDVALSIVIEVENKIKIPVVVFCLPDSMSPLYKIGYQFKKSSNKHGFTNYHDFVKSGMSKREITQCCDSAKCAVIVHTSGTTGIPKGVMLSDNCLNAVVMQLLLSGKSYQNSESALLMLPPFIGFGISILHLFVCSGMTNILWINLDVESIAKEFERVKPNRFVSGPAVVEAIMKQCKCDLEFLVDFTGGGESLSIEKEREVNKYLSSKKSASKYLTGYGMTELSAVVSMNQNDIYREGSVGIPLPHNICKVVDVNSGKELNYNMEGELCFNSPSLMMGYYNNEASYNEIVEIANGLKWLHTGDLGYIDVDGFIYIKGRIKRIYIAKGKDNMVNKLFPQRIEEIIEDQPFVDRCGVIVKPDKERINIAIAFITIGKQVKILEENELIEKIHDISRAELPEHMHPDRVIIIDKMPYNSSGKIDYRALEKMYED